VAHQGVPSPRKEETSHRQGGHSSSVVLAVVVMCMALGLGTVAVLKLPAEWSWTGVVIPTIPVALVAVVLMKSEIRRDREHDEEVRGRVRTAEAQLAAPSDKRNFASQDGHDPADLAGGPNSGKPENDQLILIQLLTSTREKADEDRAFAARRLDLSSKIGLAAMMFGFLFMLAAIIYAIHAQTASAGIATIISAISAALIAYISKTFTRDREAAASDLRQFSAKELEILWRLAAERLATGSSKADGSQQADILRTIAQDMSVPENNRLNAKSKKKKKTS
jgi:membrane protein implicated in regulation of membrane protease activity